MGGLEVATAALVAGKTLNDLSHSQKSAKSQMKNLQLRQIDSVKKKQNILDKQLASRRARLGAMGISSSASENALQNNMISETYNDIYNDALNYNYQYSKIKNDYSHQLRKSLLDMGSSAIGGIDDGKVIK